MERFRKARRSTLLIIVRNERFKTIKWKCGHHQILYTLYRDGDSFVSIRFSNFRSGDSHFVRHLLRTVKCDMFSLKKIRQDK